MRVIHSLPITDEASVGAARRGVNAFASEAGLSGQERAELDIVVQEIGTNAVRYATHLRDDGCILNWARLGGESPDDSRIAPEAATPFANAFHEASRRGERCAPHQRCGVELFYTDRGPGIYDLDRALNDHVSFGGSLGGGFGAIRRLTDEFHIYSTVRRTERLSLSGVRRSTHGTAILCRKWSSIGSNAMQTPDASLTIGAWSRPHPSETLNGDAYHIHIEGERTLLAVVDGLGHGAGALDAARVALASLSIWDGEPLDELIYRTHDALRATRGAVMSVALVDRQAGKLHFAGVGNIHTRVFNSPVPVHPIPINGTLGVRLIKVPLYTYTWADGATLIMASDGLSATWDINAYPNLLAHPPQLVAGILMRDYARLSDDATVLVVR